MSSNGQHRASTPGQVLHWPGRVVTAQDLQRQLNGHGEIIVVAKAILTPSAIELLKAGGVRVSRQSSDGPAEQESKVGTWGVAQERPYASVESAVQSLGHDGLTLRELTIPQTDGSCGWARGVAECIARGECHGGVVFCADPGLVCCIANKLGGLRAAAVSTAAQAARASSTLGVNLAAVEMPGRTFFEVRQILKTLCAKIACPEGVACTLQELDGHAHR